MKRNLQYLSCVVISVLLLALSSAAQVSVGDNVHLGLEGDVSTGYSGAYGSSGSSHGIDFGGSATLHGSYYNPQFISFTVQPYYNRSQANSAYQSINDSSGFLATANIFSGSRFPGSISVGKTSNSLGQFGVPGVTGLSTDSSGHTYEIGWSALLPNLPTLNVSYLAASEDSSIYGTDGRTRLNTRNFNLHSNYSLAGFLFNAFYTHQSLDSVFPGVLDTSGITLRATDQQGSNSTYGIMASHKIPLRGYWSANYTRSGYNSENGSSGLTGSNSGNSNSISSTVSVMPVRNLGLSLGATYQTNVLGALQSQLVQAGGDPSLISTANESKAVTVRANSFYQLNSHLTFNAQWNHIQQYFGGSSVGTSQFGGGLSTNYAHRLLGSLTFSVGAIDTFSQEGNSGAGMYGNVAFTRKFNGWETGADFNYSQQVQTLGTVYTTSVYGYGANLRKKFGDKFYWSNSARQTHSGLAQQEGTSSKSSSYSSSILYRRYSLNGVFSQARGTAILTSQGLVAIPNGIPTPLIAAPVVFNAKSFGGGVTATIMRFTLTGSYTKALSDTTAANFSDNSTTLWNALLRCRMRKLYLNAGYTRFGQTVGTPGIQPSMLNSYYFGISRWFNVF